MPQTILLIDDSPTIRNIVKIYLMGFRAEFVEAEGGERGLQILRLMPVNLVIADINMPGMDGLTFTQQVRADSRPLVKSLPIILLTGDKSEEIKKKGFEYGANEFIQKPVSSSNLIEAVKKLMPDKPAA